LNYLVGKTSFIPNVGPQSLINSGGFLKD